MTDLPKRVIALLTDSANSAEQFKVLKDAHKDILLNYDKYILNNKQEGTANATQDESKDTLRSLNYFMKDALNTLLEERRYLKNDININKQTYESTHIFQRMLASLPHILQTLPTEKQQSLKLFFILMHAY